MKNLKSKFIFFTFAALLGVVFLSAHKTFASIYHNEQSCPFVDVTEDERELLGQVANVLDDLQREIDKCPQISGDVAGLTEALNNYSENNFQFMTNSITDVTCTNYEVVLPAQFNKAVSDLNQGTSDPNAYDYRISTYKCPPPTSNQQGPGDSNGYPDQPEDGRLNSGTRDAIDHFQAHTQVIGCMTELLDTEMQNMRTNCSFNQDTTQNIKEINAERETKEKLLADLSYTTRNLMNNAESCLDSKAVTSNVLSLASRAMTAQKAISMTAGLSGVGMALIGETFSNYVTKLFDKGNPAQNLKNINDDLKFNDMACIYFDLQNRVLDCHIIDSFGKPGGPFSNYPQRLDECSTPEELYAFGSFRQGNSITNMEAAPGIPSGVFALSQVLTQMSTNDDDAILTGNLQRPTFGYNYGGGTQQELLLDSLDKMMKQEITVPDGKDGDSINMTLREHLDEIQAGLKKKIESDLSDLSPQKKNLERQRLQGMANRLRAFTDSYDGFASSTGDDFEDRSKALINSARALNQGRDNPEVKGDLYSYDAFTSLLEEYWEPRRGGDDPLVKHIVAQRINRTYSLTFQGSFSDLMKQGQSRSSVTMGKAFTALHNGAQKGFMKELKERYEILERNRDSIPMTPSGRAQFMNYAAPLFKLCSLGAGMFHFGKGKLNGKHSHYIVNNSSSTYKRYCGEFFCDNLIQPYEGGKDVASYKQYQCDMNRRFTGLMTNLKGNTGGWASNAGGETGGIGGGILGTQKKHMACPPLEPYPGNTFRGFNNSLEEPGRGGY